jgi:hypothetical protein
VLNESPCERSSHVGMRREFLGLRNGDSSGTQRKGGGGRPPLEAVTGGQVKMQQTEYASV